MASDGVDLPNVLLALPLPATSAFLSLFLMQFLLIQLMDLDCSQGALPFHRGVFRLRQLK